MARQQIPVTRPGAVTGAAPAQVVPVADDDLYFVNDGQTLLEIENPSGGPDTVTIPTPATLHGLAVADASIVVAAAETRVVGPFPGIFTQPDGTVHVDVATAVCRFRAFSTAT